ncbi:hypothetical protein [Brucella anthropi]|uniref:hypothetical protein n=1 Tax=Brucella anthropi TaxID=529 RepID=UPI00124F20C8|nr:hypothetical protein [Brucella anthropi]KAB2752518.1 hypothetical protein F9L05_05220 [Brucella anthropi]MDH0368424.1 hypothetical protein [Brucella anthropi]
MVNAMRTREVDLIDPAIAVIAKYGDEELGLEISVLAKKLREILKPKEDDLLPLHGRSDDRLSQIIRNLVSHRTLDKKGLANYRKGTSLTRGSYILTELGRASVKETWARKLK